MNGRFYLFTLKCGNSKQLPIETPKAEVLGGTKQLFASRRAADADTGKPHQRCQMKG